TAIHTPVRLTDGGFVCFTTTAIRNVALGWAGRFCDGLHVSMIKSKQGVVDHGEVFTPAWMVDAMLDLVGDEADRIDSRFWSPLAVATTFWCVCCSASPPLSRLSSANRILRSGITPCLG
ncbi:MAG: hypothetical protein U1D06_11630, partial [Paracoccaceae bacterium]|nr:hypothetical protein [Paracoccaceae bacterium]